MSAGDCLFVQCTLSCHDFALRRRSGAQWDKQHGVDVERERLLARTRDAVARGLLAGNLWHTASNAEHARPMLQVRRVPFGSADSTTQPGECEIIAFMAPRMNSHLRYWMLQLFALWNTLTCEFCLQTMKITHQMTALLLICMTCRLSLHLSPTFPLCTWANLWPLFQHL
jgi:hypothetical protein